MKDNVTVIHMDMSKCSECEKGICEYAKKCVSCGSDNILYRNYSHVCLQCNTLQDVVLLEPFIVCKKHGKFDREKQECPKCMAEW